MLCRPNAIAQALVDIQNTILYPKSHHTRKTQKKLAIKTTPSETCPRNSQTC